MRRILTFAIFLSLLTGCANISSLLPMPETATAPPSTPTAVTSTPALNTPTSTPSGPRTLRIWLPPQFDPFAGTTAGKLLQVRLEEFAARRPDMRIDVRVKAEDGTSNMLNALSTARSAAPSAMPDLVALSRADLESATAKGLLHPLDGLSTLPEESDWFPYAREMAHIQNSTFGMPFAGDALALVGFRYPMVSNWSEVSNETIFIFPADDPRALFTLSLYLSAGGTLEDSQGHLALNEAILADVLSFYSPDPGSDFISPQVVNYENSDQAWNAFLEQRANLVVSWTSRFLNEDALSLALAPLPGLESGYYTLATGWSWALAGSNPDNQVLAVELAEFLSESQFLAEWTQAAGYLPTRPTALSSWEDARMQLTLTQSAESASLIPGEDLLVTIGPLFTEATLSVLTGEQLPTEAAHSVIEQLE
jgi:multiple sugar transport system substrate-binding protein